MEKPVGLLLPRRATVAKGVDIEMAPLDEDHVRAKSPGPSRMSVAENSL
jgi:hypothetical protein